MTIKEYKETLKEYKEMCACIAAVADYDGFIASVTNDLPRAEADQLIPGLSDAWMREHPEDHGLAGTRRKKMKTTAV